MDTTPTPINEDDDLYLAHRAPINTRYANDDDTVTLVAYSVDPINQRAEPCFIADADLDKKPSTHWYDRMAEGSIPLWDRTDLVADDETLRPVAPDAERSQLAQAALDKRAEPTFRDTLDFTRVTLRADLNSDEEVHAFLGYAKAELKVRELQYQLERASQDRSQWIGSLVDLQKSQRAVGRTLGRDQSTISRAMRERREMP